MARIQSKTSGTRKGVSKSRGSKASLKAAGRLKLSVVGEDFDTYTRRTRKLGPVYVAVIARKDATLESSRYGSGLNDGTWAALMGHDKDELVADALKLVQKYGASTYEAWVGVVSEKVVIPTNFKLVKL